MEAGEQYSKTGRGEMERKGKEMAEKAKHRSGRH
jgi:hypothetical protein